MNFYVLSEPIQAGKTTNLESWLKRKENNKEVWGIISPDRKGLRHFDAVSPLHSESIAVEVAEDLGKQLVQEGDNDIFTVGKKCFYFRHSAFNWAISHLNKSLSNCVNNFKDNKQVESWLVLDEVGPLEVKQNKGFDSFMKNLVAEYKSLQTNNSTQASLNFLIVVRQGLVDDFVQHYELDISKIHVIQLKDLQNT